ncbi:MAG TPA: galactokinase family protein [Candidatus Acidoferrales bacterium]|nr:galactokinase family protein [Candidatus Acidoferrales bacterium]
MSAVESSAKSALFARLLRELQGMREGGASFHYAFFIPGRLEFLGKHTDYAGGRSLLCAIEHGICIVAAPRDDAQICIFDAGRASSVDFEFTASIEPTAGHWSNFPMTVARRLARDFPGKRVGADIVFASDLPRASGMSSSSAFMVAIFFVLAQANELWQTQSYLRAISSREDLAGYLAAIESGASYKAFLGTRGVGTHGGSEDHVAILCSRAGFLRQYSFCPIHFEREISLPERHRFVIGVSGVKADKTGDARDAYNRASEAAERIMDLWRRTTGRSDSSLAAVLSSYPEASDQLRQILSGSKDADYPASALLDRVTQFAEESNGIIPSAGDALARGDFARLGVLVDRSQFLAETLLKNQVPETIELARSARSFGAAAASAFGAGFGGSVWALVDSGREEEFCNAWAAHYHQRFPERADDSRFFVSGPGPGLVQFD